MELVKSTVFLGVTLDSKLQWQPHIITLSGKLSPAIFAVKKIRQFTDIDTARLVFFSYFHSVMSYSILLQGKAADIQSIFNLQKRAIRTIYKLSARTSLRELFKEIGILPQLHSTFTTVSYMSIKIFIFLRKGATDTTSTLGIKTRFRCQALGYRNCHVHSWGKVLIFTIKFQLRSEEHTSELQSQL